MVSFSGRKKQRNKKSYLKHLRKIHPLSHRIVTHTRRRAAATSEGLAAAKAEGGYQCINAMHQLNSFIEALPREMENDDQTPIETRFLNFAKELGFPDPWNLHPLLIYGSRQEKVDYFVSHFVLQIDAKPFAPDLLYLTGDMLAIDINQNISSSDSEFADFPDHIEGLITQPNSPAGPPNSPAAQPNSPAGPLSPGQWSNGSVASQ